jgi:hypothetical protein
MMANWGAGSVEDDCMKIYAYAALRNQTILEVFETINIDRPPAVGDTQEHRLHRKVWYLVTIVKYAAALSNQDESVHFVTDINELDMYEEDHNSYGATRALRLANCVV